MPLKHLTETVLVVLLALVTIVTGVVVSTLPHIPDGFFPWVGIFVATVIYPALIYPILKNNRADYSFRLLHFAPVAITLLWMFIEIALLKEPKLTVLHRIFTWGWTAPAVVVTFLLLAVFCLQVIRRRVPRLFFLVLLFTPFIATAYASERYTHWDAQLATLLWKSSPIEIAMQPGTPSSSTLAQSSKGEKNLASSSLPEEEAWRQKLRAVEEGKVHSGSSSVNAAGGTRGVQAVMEIEGAMSSGVPGKTHIAVKPRTHLPTSGGEFEAMVIFFVAAYAATMHVKARKLRMA